MNDAAVSTGDWNLLLDAVILRLQRCVGESLSLESVRPMQAASKSMQVGVLERVDALGHLQDAYSTRSRTPFRCDGGQHSAVMADTVPS